ncbi:MAG: glycoside hydrolase family 3 C-terminal domain-containing protein [Chitinophagaceae bacterium]|nr:glycoside hydrolase family 3 C-terminal domain-containing protein [Chitinophagaceae bacterium]
MRHSFLFLLAIIVFSGNILAQGNDIAKSVDSLMRLMTLEEKVGQLHQITSDFAATGPITQDGEKQDRVRKGMVGSYLNVTGAARTRSLQEIAMQSRLKIPLLFAQDVIHGFRTIFPLPLAEAASWDMDAIERSARIAAKEAAASGIHWTFAPMVDISRDPRWGRVMEGAGEDTYLGSLIARARVKGFQGKSIGDVDALLACAKHFAAYGAAEGGRDYNTTDMSWRRLYEVYLPPFQAAREAGVASFMNSFNDINGIPATGHTYLQRKLLKGDWNFKGIVVSDWGSVGEMVNHGYAADLADAAKKAILAGCDMDMESRAYSAHLAALVKKKEVDIKLLDDAVRRILRKKFELGLFKDPYRFSNEAREQSIWNEKNHLDAARDIAKKSIVLLKNEAIGSEKNTLLPMRGIKNKKIALLGPLVKAIEDNNGFWSYSWPDDSVRVVSLWKGMMNKFGADNSLLYSKGCNITGNDTSGFAAARQVALQSDLIIISLGESANMSGEAKSRSSIHLPGVQEQLVQEMTALGKPVIVLISAGRPLIFNWIADNVPAIVYTWWLGTEAGNAIADVLSGDYNPSAKLPMTFPRSEGQIPIYYNYFSTGRPFKHDNDNNYVTAYKDLQNSPRYPFGYGLSYTRFEYGRVKLSADTISQTQQLSASIQVSNTGSYEGEEVVQLYIQDVTASLVRPVRELKAFQKIKLAPGESREVKFVITKKELSFYLEDLRFIAEPGQFNVFIGGSSLAVEKASFYLR